MPQACGVGFGLVAVARHDDAEAKKRAMECVVNGFTKARRVVRAWLRSRRESWSSWLLIKPTKVTSTDSDWTRNR